MALNFIIRVPLHLQQCASILASMHIISVSYFDLPLVKPLKCCSKTHHMMEDYLEAIIKGVVHII